MAEWSGHGFIPIRLLGKARLGCLALAKHRPFAPVEVTNNLTYVEGKPDDANKHKLDPYLPKARKSAPVFIFFHGGAWRTGTAPCIPPWAIARQRRHYYGIPAIAWAPKNKHPAQVQDAASAFAWDDAEHCGLRRRYESDFIGGHSAGGHMAALLALDDHLLAAHHLSPQNIRGVVSLSGVFDLDIGDSQAGVSRQRSCLRKNASPMKSYHSLCTTIPGELLSMGLRSSRRPGTALQRSSAQGRCSGHPSLYASRENHISEVIVLTHDDDPTARALLQFLR